MDRADTGRTTATATRRAVLSAVGAATLGIGVEAAAGQDTATDTTAAITTGNGTDTETATDIETATGTGNGTDTGTRTGSDAGFVLVQGDRCVPLQPVSGDQPVEELYDYGTERYSSRGTTDLQRADASILFLYDGPEGTSLVLVHGRLDGGDDGGSVSFAIEGLPAGGQWVIRDDSYERPTRYDRWSIEGTTAQVDWTWREDRADGGVYRGLGVDTAIEIDPAFNEAAALYGEHYDGTVRRWQAVSGDRDDPRYVSLAMDQPVRILSGACSEAAGTLTGTGTTTGDASANGTVATANATATTTTTGTTTTATATDTPTATETAGETSTDTATTTTTTTATAAETTDRATTATEGPGFGGVAAVTALASAAAYLRSRASGD